MFGRRKPQQRDETIHRGRIFGNATRWTYKCGACDYGAGTNGPGSSAALPWLIDLATKHADPNDWTRNRGVR